MEIDGNQTEADDRRHGALSSAKTSVSKQFRCQDVCPYGISDSHNGVSTMRVISRNRELFTSEVSLIPSWNSGFARRLQQLKTKEKNESKRKDANASCTGKTNGVSKNASRDFSLIPSGIDHFAKKVQSLKVQSIIVQSQIENQILKLKVDHRIQDDDAHSSVTKTTLSRKDVIEGSSTEEMKIHQKFIPKIPASIIMEVIGSYTNDRKAWNSLAALSRETLDISKKSPQLYRPWPSIRWRATTTTANGGPDLALYREQRQRRRKARGAVQTSARPRTVAFGKTYLCYGTDRGEVLLRNLHGYGSIKVRRGHRGCVDCVKCYGNWLFSAGDDLGTKIWNVTTMSCEAILDDHLDTITSIAILPIVSSDIHLDSCSASFFCMLVATAGLDGDVHLYAIYCEGEKVVYTKHIAIFAEEGLSKQIHSIVLYQKDGKKSLISGGQDGRLRLWDIDAAIGDRIKDYCIDIESKTSATRISSNTSIYRYDGEIKSIAISRDNARIAAAFGRTICYSYLSDKTLRSYDFLHHQDHNHRFQRRLEQQRRLRNQRQNVESVGSNSVLDTEEDHWKVLKGHSGDIRCIDFSPDGKAVASACSDGSIRLWQLGEGTWKRKWKAHNGFMVRSLAISPDGQSLLSAGSDGTIAIESLFS